MRRSRRDRVRPPPPGTSTAAHSGRGEADRLTPPPHASTDDRVRSPRFEMTVGAFLARQRAGALHEGPRAELVDGRAAPALHVSPSEAAALVTLTRNLHAAGVGELGVDIVQWAPLRLGPVDLVRAPVALMPGPSFVQRGRGGEARERQGESTAGIGGSHDPAAALLVVETVATAAAQRERLARYAAAGARELWLLDVRRGWVESLRSPWRAEYRSRTLWYPGEAVPISALHTVSLEVLAPP